MIQEILIPLGYKVSINVIDVVRDIICDKTYYRNWSAKSRNHIAEPAWVGNSFEKHTQVFYDVTNTSLFTSQH